MPLRLPEERGRGRSFHRARGEALRSPGLPNTGMDETGATHILLDPASPVDARVLYVAGFGRGVYKSSDGGRTWALKINGITQEQPFAWRLAQSSNGTLYVVIARRSEDGSIGNAGDGALYRSMDGAEHWHPVSLPEGTNGPNGMAIDVRRAWKSMPVVFPKNALRF